MIIRRQTVGTSETSVSLLGETPVVGVRVIAHPANTNTVYVNTVSPVTGNGTDATDGLPLTKDAGLNELFIPADTAKTLNALFLIAGAASQAVTVVIE